MTARRATDDETTTSAAASGLAPDPFRAVSVTRSYEHVVRQIEDQIRNGRFARGARLPAERELGATFGVSRGVVREAIKVLTAMGLVESRQGSGLYVRNDPLPTVTRALTLSVSPDAESVERLFEFRRELEVAAARLAAARRDDAHLDALAESLAVAEDAAGENDWETFVPADGRFHAIVADASGNPYLAVATRAAREMQRDVVALISRGAGSVATATRHHRAILDAIAAGDPEDAARAMAEHIVYTNDAVHDELARRDVAVRAEERGR